MKKELFSKYQELKEIEKNTKAALEELQPLVIEEMTKSNVDKVKAPYGSFTLEKRKVWRYTSAVEHAKEIMESIKADEEATGKAKFDEKYQLRFTAIKKDE